MRSVKHHCLYWLVACAAATIYQVLTLKSGVPAVLFYVLLVPLLPFFVILVVRGPRDEPWPRLYHIATAALLISLGCFCSTFRLSAPDVARPGFDPRPFAHCCLAFQVLGSLESIRQNRLDIDPCNVGLLHGAPDACFSYPKKRTLLRRFLDVIRLRLLYLTVLAPLALALDGLLRRLYASEMSFTSVALGSISVPRHVGNPAMLFYIGAALADVAETVKHYTPPLQNPFSNFSTLTRGGVGGRNRCFCWLLAALT
ncbi:uncharacterized protein UV8b_01808 [Ustilaginoidea virens]|uniref:Uncharacterized protein n=1 Tax=Ustilaginoidea virens TaxID=1159556 RepID=A0A8E5MFA3_USTVR|nr:uncharacterized protein UV8b_01808 [Ustilaginoidea virens]QUC17567.1 hypothetical protein UV8b_01808 [Ustilaginoidea virens]